MQTQALHAMLMPGTLSTLKAYAGEQADLGESLCWHAMHAVPIRAGVQGKIKALFEPDHAEHAVQIRPGCVHAVQIKSG